MSWKHAKDFDKKNNNKNCTVYTNFLFSLFYSSDVILVVFLMYKE